MLQAGVDPFSELIRLLHYVADVSLVFSPLLSCWKSPSRRPVERTSYPVRRRVCAFQDLQQSQGLACPANRRSPVMLAVAVAVAAAAAAVGVDCQHRCSDTVRSRKRLAELRIYFIDDATRGRDEGTLTQTIGMSIIRG